MRLAGYGCCYRHDLRIAFARGGSPPRLSSPVTDAEVFRRGEGSKVAHDPPEHKGEQGENGGQEAEQACPLRIRLHPGEKGEEETAEGEKNQTD